MTHSLFLLSFVSFILIHQCISHFWRCHVSPFEFTNSLQTFLSFCALLILQSQVFFPFHCLFSTPLPLSITLLTPPPCLFSYPSHSVLVCLDLCPSPRSLPDSFFHLLVSCFMKLVSLCIGRQHKLSLQFLCVLSHSTAHLASIISFCLFMLPHFPNSVNSISFPPLLFFILCMFLVASFLFLLTHAQSNHFLHVHWHLLSTHQAPSLSRSLSPLLSASTGGTATRVTKHLFYSPILPLSSSLFYLLLLHPHSMVYCVDVWKFFKTKQATY